jgi:hypothetical protein
MPARGKRNGVQIAAGGVENRRRIRAARALAGRGIEGLRPGRSGARRQDAAAGDR